MGIAKYCPCWGLILLLFFEYVESDLFYDVLSKVDPCEAFCEKTYPVGAVGSSKYGSCCRRGCRFFNLVYLVENREKVDINATKATCQASCMEAYIHTKDRYACNLGCASMAKHKQIDFIVSSQVSWSVYMEDGNNVLMLQPGGDIEPDDVLTDPGLRQQLQRNWAGLPMGDDRLPETHIRTLPAISDQNVDGLSPGDWLDCATFKSGLPRIVMIVAVVLPVLLALWLWLTPGRQFTLEDMEALTEFKDPFDCPPPKYTSLMMEKV